MNGFAKIQLGLFVVAVLLTVRVLWAEWVYHLPPLFFVLVLGVNLCACAVTFTLFWRNWRNLP